jgi:hypothetical protein
MPALLLVVAGVVLGLLLALAAVTGSIWFQSARALRRPRPRTERPGRDRGPSRPAPRK